MFSKGRKFLNSKISKKYCRGIVTPSSGINSNENYLNNNVEIRTKDLTLMESTWKYIGGVLMFPFGFFNVDINDAYVVTRFGKLECVAYEGLNYSLPVGRSLYIVNLGVRSFKLSNCKVVDCSGRPIILSAIVNYKIDKPEKFIANINSKESFIHHQADATIKQIVSEYPYDSTDGKNLRTGTKEISNVMKSDLQKLVECAGVRVLDIRLTDLNYAPEIAQSMLMEQRAKSYIDAKSVISKSTIDIIRDTLKGLEDLGIPMTPDQKVRLANNLITVISSGGSVQLVIPITTED
jgi:hypothetical protein